MDALLKYITSLDLSSLVGGAGLVGLLAGLRKLWRTYWKQNRKNDAQEHNQDLELAERLEQRLTKVEGRLDAAEEELRNTKKELAKSRIRREELQAAIDALVERIDTLLDRLEEHEQITEQERDRMTSVPYVDTSNDSTQQ